MYSFICTGHENILSTQRNTFEFTKDLDLTIKGDCIIGLGANFELDKIKPLLKYKKLKITIETKKHKEEILCNTNKDFDDSHEIVIRKTDFCSKRTLGVLASKSSLELNRDLIKELKNKNITFTVKIEGIKNV